MQLGNEKIEMKKSLLSKIPDRPARTATAQAFSNIAFIKYWGNRDQLLRLPANGSISMNLEGLFTRTRVEFRADSDRDRLVFNEQEIRGTGLGRVSAFLDITRDMAGIKERAEVDSRNNFPTGTGIASSASAFAALALAATRAAGLDLSEAELSRLARRGSGSACRSVPGGFVEWQMGTSDEDSYATSIADPDHWPLVDCIAILSIEHKTISSTEGHTLAETSPLQAARLADATRRLDLCRRAILERDFEALATVTELDSDMMHAVMMTSTPPLLYWLPTTLAVMEAVRAWRKGGLSVCYTIDAGPNVHVLCPEDQGEQVARRLNGLGGIQRVLSAKVGGAARLVS
jgi:diphosphomevalonate decarboxylase